MSEQHPRPRYSAAQIAEALTLHPPTQEQRAVIEAPLTSMLVVAGAGSGKTETMSGRVVWLVANGLVAPDRILGLTFTRKAAGELSERIGGRLRDLAAAGVWAAPTPAEATESAGPSGTSPSTATVLLEPDALPTVATYHSYAGALVREHGLRLGVEPDARLLTEAAAWQYAHEVVGRYDGPMNEVDNAESTVTAAVRDLAGQCAEHLCTISDLDTYLQEVERHVSTLPQGSGRRSMPAPVRDLLAHVRAQRQVLPLLDAYARLKSASESLDFADQMALAAALAELDPTVPRAERARWSVVLLDEFQDTSEAQMRLLHRLFADPGAGSTRPVTAVGDPHQSIYGWRGASATTLAAFPRRFTVPADSLLVDDAADEVVEHADIGDESTDTGTAEDSGESAGTETPSRSVGSGGDLEPPVLPLSTSWRNDEAVLAIANATAAPLSEASPVPVRRLRPSPAAKRGIVEAARLTTANDEAEYVAARIAEQWWRQDEPGTPRRHSGISAAVLCRRRAQFNAIADALGAHGIPVEVVGLGGLLTRPEVSDIVSLLRVVHDPSRGDALMRLLTGPFVRLGAADLDALGAWSRAMGRAGSPSVGTPGDTSDTSGSIVEPTAEHVHAAHPIPPAVPGCHHDPAPGHLTDTGHLTDSGMAMNDADRDDGDEPSIVEAVDALPDPDWVGPQGERLSITARHRLRRLADAIETVRVLVGQPLPELVVLAERALGLDVEVAAGVDTLPQTARRHLDAFADAAAGFAYGADRPTLGGFLDWLDAARDEERGLDSPAAEVTEGAVQVLTVHAAKGLEWDVVAVPGLVEASFPSHRSYYPPKDGGLPSPSSKGWLTGLGSIPYDLRGDAEGLPRLPWKDVADLGELASAIGTFAALGGRHALDEERRLAYVAFTRARHRLLLTASVWLDGEKPRVPSRFLTELLDTPGLVTVTQWAPDPEPDADNPAHADLVAATWPTCRRDARDEAVRHAADLVLAAASDPEPVAVGGEQPVMSGEMADRAHLVEVLLAERSRPRSREVVAHLPGHLSTSAVVELRTDARAFAERLRRPMPAPPATAARLGTAFHSWIEQHYRSAALVDDLELEGYADDTRDDDAGVVTDLAAAKELFLASEWAGRAPVAVEVSLETVIAGMPVRGRIDAVFDGPGDGVTIIDWKTGSPPSPSRLAERSVQLAVYRLAYARWSGIPIDNIHAAFYYAATGDTVYPTLPAEADLVRLLQDPDSGLSDVAPPPDAWL